MSLTHVQLLSVPVSDQDRAQDFYVGTLGFDLIADTELGPGQRWVQVGARGAQTSLTLVTWFDTMPAGSLRGLVIESDDLEADIKALGDRGLAVSDLQAAPWGQFVTCEDPDGNGLILQATAAPGPRAG
jgi:catechol 2,3-dioxygenase-like lactoylglutathione lyase family enzyme